MKRGVEVVGIKGVYCISSSSTCIKTSTGGNFFIFKERLVELVGWKGRS